MTTPPDQTAVPVCPRHPDRESYVRCQRCSRPVCPQCQRQAAVGVQCVDCARAGTRDIRPARTVFGGQPTGGRPLVTWTLIALCVVANLLQRVPGLGVTEAFAFVPAFAGTEPWRLITAAFLHAYEGTFGLFHIALNMYALYILGPYLEDLFGRARFLVLYLVSALGGSVAFELLTSDVNELFAGYNNTVGASGAVFGLFGALLVVQRRLDRQLGQIVVVLAINLAYGFFIPSIAWQSHLGGLVAGALAAFVLAHAPRRNRSLVQWSGLAALTLVLLALAALGLEQPIG